MHEMESEKRGASTNSVNGNEIQSIFSLPLGAQYREKFKVMLKI